MAKKYNKDDLLFLPLGGSNEIGMNVNMYHYQGKWLMIDLGAGFADDYYPGVQMLAPDLSFIYDRREDFLGLVLTHAHEDHVGSVGYLWDSLRCPIYATPFTAAVARLKLQNEGLHDAKITTVKPGSRFDVGPFNLEMVQITHSIPEMNGIIIRTDKGNILHTGDWKLDPNPVVMPTTDEVKLKALGEEGVLAMVCDSTNVFNDRHSGSEGDLITGISELMKDSEGMVFVTTFASNVARMDTIARAAALNGRKVAITGLSVIRYNQFARDCGYLSGIDPFISDEEARSMPRNKVVVICTGCQGEENAAMTKMATGQHRCLRVTPKDTVIFSSKIIPGNEKKLFKLFNRFVRLGCEVYTEKDHLVHVSGHPSREELKKMYDWVKPEIAVPVHGEPTHLHEHGKLAKSLGVPKTVEVQNGMVVRLAPGKPEGIDFVESGYLAVDGMLLLPGKGDVMKKRRLLLREGIIFVSMALTGRGKLAQEPSISTPGVLDAEEERELLKEVAEELAEIIESSRDTSDARIHKVTRQVIKRTIGDYAGKAPPVEIHIARV